MTVPLGGEGVGFLQRERERRREQKGKRKREEEKKKDENKKRWTCLVLAWVPRFALYILALPLTRNKQQQTAHMQIRTKSPLSPPDSLAAGPLVPIQLPSQIPRPSHQFLILVLLHLEFPLPPHADGRPDLGLHRVPFAPLFPPQLPFTHMV